MVKVNSNLNYVLDVKGKHKLYHVNLLKRYFRRATVHSLNVVNESGTLDTVGIVNNVYVAQVCAVDDNDGDSKIFTLPSTRSLVRYPRILVVRRNMQ